VGDQISTYIKEQIKTNVNIKKEVCRITYTGLEGMNVSPYQVLQSTLDSKKIITKYKKTDLLFVAKD